MEQLESQQQPTSPPARRRRRRRRSPLNRVWAIVSAVQWRLVFVTLLVITVILIGGQAVLITDAINQFNSSYTSAIRVLSSISAKSGTELTLSDFERLQIAMSDLTRKLNALDSRTRFVRRVASLNSDWETQLALLDISQELTSAANNILLGIQPALFFMVDGEEEEAVTTQISSGERIVELLEIGRGRFNRAKVQIDTARRMIDAIDVSLVSPDVLLTLRNIEDYYSQLVDITTVVGDAPEILTAVLGFDETQTYLVLAQNSDELRPSGGYISTYGWLSVRNGRIIDYDYYPTTTTSPAPPSQDLASTFVIPEWWIQYQEPLFALWDGSWFASFPRTAEMARIYYNLGPDNPNAPVAGVIAIDIRGFEKVLEAMGDVRVERTIDEQTEYVVINAENFRDVVYNIRAYSEGPIPHKEFIADVYRQIFEDWQSYSSNPDVSEQLLGAVLESLLEKHIMVYSPERTIGNTLEILGWSGSQEPGIGHDYLMVADANLGNKSNRSILRQLTYDVLVNPDSTLTSRLTVAYDYPDSLASNDPAVDPEFHGPLDYNNLLQVFTPDGSTLIEAEDVGINPITAREDQHTIFVSRVRLEYDRAARYQFNYETPALLDDIGEYHSYRLLVQKQPGMLVENVNVQVSLPPDAQIISVSPAPAATYALDNIILDFRASLYSDQWFEIIFKSDIVSNATP